MNLEKIQKMHKYRCFTRLHRNLALILVSILVSSGCKDAKTLLPGEYTLTPPASPVVGYYYPAIMDYYPKTGDAYIPRNTNIVIIFNIPVNPGDLAGAISITRNGTGLTGGGADYSITSTPRVATINFTSYLSDNDAIIVTVANSITDAVNGISMVAGATINFTIPAGANPDITAPLRIVNSEFPLNGAINTSRTPGSIYVQFDENIDFSTINSATFQLWDGAAYIPATYGYNSVTHTIYLYPAVQLNKNTAYTVYLRGGAAGIKDVSGNTYSATNWTFTTVNTDIDPVAGGPVIDGPTLVALGTTSFEVTWNTNQVTSYVFHYGRTSDAGDFSPGMADFMSSRFINPAGLEVGARYWYYVSCTDLAGNTINKPDVPLPGTDEPVQINLYTNETPFDLAAGVNNQHGLRARAYYSPAFTEDGIAIFWTDDDGSDTRIYGQLFNNLGAELWAGTRALFTEGGADFTYVGSADDGLGGVIVLASRNSAEIRAKRLNASGNFVDWGSDADAANDPGFLIAAGTKAGAAIVYNGMVDTLLSGQVDEGALSMSNPFFEHMDADGAGPDNTLADYAANGDLIFDRSDGDAALIVKTASWDHEYVLGQSTAIYTASHNYSLADSTTSSSTVVDDHYMNVDNKIITTTTFTTFYLPHSGVYAKPAWVTAGSIALINGSTYARVNAVTLVPAPASIYSGNETAQSASHLYDVNGNFTGVAGLGQYDVVRDTTNGDYGIITTAVAFSSDLTLSDTVFGGTEGYQLFNRVENGQADFGLGTTRLYDSTKNFSSSCNVGDYVFIVNSSYTSITSGPYIITATANGHVDCSSGSFWYNYYIIVSQTAIGSGTADNGANIIVNTAANWSGVYAGAGITGDLIRNTSSSSFAYVTEKSNTVLKLSSDIFSGAGNGYEIYNEFCRTHDTFAQQVSSFYEIQLDRIVGTIADNQSVVFYNMKLEWSSNAESNMFPENPFYEDDNDISSLITGENGDVIFNYNNGDRSYIDETNAVIYTKHAFASKLYSDIFSADNQDYRVYGFYADNTDYSFVYDSGIVDSVTGLQVTDAGHFGLNLEGFIAFNAALNRYSFVNASAANTITLSNNTFAPTNPYLLIGRCGVLYAWENAGGVYAKIMTLALDVAASEMDPVELVPQTTIDASAIDPWVVADGYGNAYVVYLDSTDGDIQVNFYNISNTLGVLTSHWSAELDTNTASNETIRDVRSDGAGGIIVLYTYGTDLRVQRIGTDSHYIPTAISNPWGTTGRTVRTLTAGLTTLSDPAMTYDRGNDAALVVWVEDVSTDIWAARVTLTTLSAIQITDLSGSSQRLPSVYVTNAGDMALVVWDENRFLTNGGFSVFGIKLDINTGTGGITKSAGWNANDSGGTDDTDGVAIIHHNFNEDCTYPLLFPANNNSGVYLFWTDYELSANGSDQFYINPLIQTYLPAF